MSSCGHPASMRRIAVVTMVSCQQLCAPQGPVVHLCLLVPPHQGADGVCGSLASSQIGAWSFEVGRGIMSLSVHVVAQVCLRVPCTPFSLVLGAVARAGRPLASQPPQLHPVHTTESFILVTPILPPPYSCPPFHSSPCTCTPARSCCTSDMLQCAAALCWCCLCRAPHPHLCC